MRYRFLVLVVLLVANASMAQKDLLSCVVPDIRGVLLPETIAPPFSCAVPDELAGLELPVDPVFIGSIEGLHRRIALYRSALAPGEAVDAVTAALHDRSWRDLAIDALTGGGFVMGGPPPHRLLCRDTSTLNVRAHGFDATTEVRLLITRNPHATSCEDLPGNGGSGIDGGGEPQPQEYLPGLALSDGVASAVARVGLAPSHGAFWARAAR